jgi:hypothetical protein
MGFVKMGLDTDASEYFELLKHDLFTLRIEWRMYRSFFRTNLETVEMLNDVSGSTAHTLERVLFERCLLGIRRMTDPSTGRNRSTEAVTIKGLSKRIDLADTELKKLVSDAERAASFARNWSSKRIAHADLEYRLGGAKLETASRAKVETAIDGIAAVIKWVSLEYLDVHQVTHVLPPLDDERAFLKAIFFGQRELRRLEALRKTLLADEKYAELDSVRKETANYPDWLQRNDPPTD